MLSYFYFRYTKMKDKTRVKRKEIEKMEKMRKKSETRIGCIMCGRIERTQNVMYGGYTYGLCEDCRGIIDSYPHLTGIIKNTNQIIKNGSIWQGDNNACSVCHRLFDWQNMSYIGREDNATYMLPVCVDCVPIVERYPHIYHHLVAILDNNS